MAKVHFETPAGYELDSEEYYENRVVKAGRKNKQCAYCGEEIPIGQQHTVHKFYGDGDFPSYPTHDMSPVHGDSLQPGEKSCTQLLKEGLKLASYY